MLAAIEARPGTYALVLSARANGLVRVGRLGGLRLQPGFYVYVGSALALLTLDFRQKQTRELLGQRDISMNEAAQTIGRAIGKTDLRYVHAPDEQVRPALIQLGMSPDMADLLLEMSGSLNSGYMRALEPRSAPNTTPTPYETFVAEEFVPLYERQSAAA